MSKIVVTGGCGYIGSHTIVDLIEHGFEIVCIDNNVRSSDKILQGVNKITKKNIENNAIDICDINALKKVFEKHPDISGVIHFAAYKSVPESVKEPLMYYQNNLNGLLNILECLALYQIPNFIFSSSCSVYGNSTELPVTESTALNKAESPYARTKQMGEQIIQDFSLANPTINFLLLRYFNPAGAHSSGLLGEIAQENAKNVVPLLIESLLGLRPTFEVTGNDYDTRDGSCVRDYIHIMDLADAHTKSLQFLQKKQNDNNCMVFNVGIGQGVTVLELIAAFDKATGQQLDYKIGKRRAGDVASIYSDYSKAKKILGWEPKYSVDEILATAWKWHQNGYNLD